MFRDSAASTLRSAIAPNRSLNRRIAETCGGVKQDVRGFFDTKILKYLTMVNGHLAGLDQEKWIRLRLPTDTDHPYNPSQDESLGPILVGDLPRVFVRGAGF
jgi:hypothetical protein